MLPLLSSMHLVKDWVAPEQLLPQVLLFVVSDEVDWTGAAGAASALEPPLKKPPMAWPMEEPMATPLLCFCGLVSSPLVFATTTV